MGRTTSATAAPRSKSSAGTAAPTQPRPPRRNLRLVVVGILAICLGALAGAALYMQNAHTQQVLRVTHAVSRGTVVQAGDLGTVSLPAVPGVATVPAQEASSLVGKEALTDLPEGALIAPGAVGEPAVAKGTVHVGLRLAPGRAPARALPVGAPVLLLPVPGSSPQGATPAASASYRATVVTAPTSQPDGSQLLDLAVAAGDAAQVVKLAAGDQLALAREGER